MKINTSKIIFTILAGACFLNTYAQKEKERITKYVEQYKEFAIAEMIRTGVPASITLAQGVLETGFGQSDLALLANNHFGIKCKAEWAGETILHDDDRKGECFRKYACVADSYKDHSDFLLRPNYAFLFALDPSDYRGWAKGLKKAGYATNPTYAERLMTLIEENDLQQYTLLVLQQKPGSTAVPLVDVNTPIPVNEKVATITPVNNSAFIPQPQILEHLPNKPIYPKGLFVINETKVIFVAAGTSLLAIANIYGITYSKLLDFNELDNTDILVSDQLIFLERKPKKGLTEYHTVAFNETLYDICQKEGIQMISVLEYNHLQKGMNPAVGEKLFLKVKAVSSPRLAMKNTAGASSM